MSKRPTPKQKLAKGRSTRRYASFSYKTKKRLNNYVQMAMHREKTRQRAGIALEKGAKEKKITRIKA